MQLLLFNAFNGLIQGVFYALMALGLALILSLNSVINMAHGGFLVIGAYLAYTLSPYLGFWGALIAGPILAGVDRPDRRARADPADLQARRSALQPAADVRPRVDHRGPDAHHLGPAGAAARDSRHHQFAGQRRVLLRHRLPAVRHRHHGGGGDRALSFVALHAARHPHPRRHARSRNDRRRLA